MIGIYVFSGTGNTAKCAKALYRELLSQGVDVNYHKITDGSETATEDNLIICYPIHGFNAPSNVIRFAKGLKACPNNGTDGNVYFFKTSGEPLSLNDASSGQLIRILTKKNYNILGEYHYIMPYNMVFRHSDDMASLMWRTARRRIKKDAVNVAKGIRQPINYTFTARIVSLLCRIEHWFYPRNGRLYRVDTNKCINCGKCVNNCPTNNISMKEGKLQFADRCVSCTSCSFNCPTAAIHIGIIDFLRVNGPYDFHRKTRRVKLCRYCNRLYREYFSEK